jgi:hypothetical protein
MPLNRLRLLSVESHIIRHLKDETDIIRSLNEISRMSLCMFVQHPHLYIPIPVPPLWSFIRSLFDSHERAVCQQLFSMYSHGAPLTHHGIVGRTHLRHFVTSLRTAKVRDFDGNV